MGNQAVTTLAEGGPESSSGEQDARRVARRKDQWESAWELDLGWDSELG